MGVECKHYVVVGVDLKKEIPNFNLYKFFNEDWDKIDNLHNTSTTQVGMISDVICGEYEIACILIAEAGGKSDPVHIELPLDSVDIEEMAKKVRAFCSDEFNIVVEPKIISFTHFY